MVTKDYTPSDGKKRTITGKVFGDEFRIYRIYGDVTNKDALAEMAQEIAIEFKVVTVRVTN